MTQPSPPTSRFGFAASLQSRDGSLSKGALITNGYFDKADGFHYRRPGLSSYAALGTTSPSTGAGQYWGGGMAAVRTPGTNGFPTTSLYAKRGLVLYQITNPTLPPTDQNWQRTQVIGGSFSLGVNDGTLAACLANYAPVAWGTQADGADTRLCVQYDGTRYWVYGSGQPTGTGNIAALNNLPSRLAYGSYSGGLGASITSAVGTFTGGYASPTEKLDWITGAGSTVVIKSIYYASVYNGTSLTNIASSYPAITVPGIVYLDGTYYVMGPDGSIYNSTAAADDPTTWPGDTISAEYDRDGGVCLAKALNYVVALCNFTVQMFWDAANPTGSPLSPVNNGVLLIGCASAGSVAQTESTVIFIAHRKSEGSTSHKGRFVAILVGTSYKVVSNDDVDRVLDSDDLAEVYSCVIEVAGHTWYVLTLVTSGITLVYDFTTELWLTWTLLSPGTAQGLAGLVLRNGLVTGTSSSAHGWSDGDPVVISGAGQAGFNGTFNVNVTGTKVFTYPLSTTGTTTGTGASLQGQGYNEAAFTMIAACGIGNVQVVQDRAGSIWQAALNNQVDGTSSVPINWKMRSVNRDEGNNERKFCRSVAVYGDILSTAAALVGPFLLRNSDDDYQTWTYFRRFDLSQTRSNQQRWGNYRRRAWEGRYTGTAAWRLKELEPDLEQGDT